MDNKLKILYFTTSILFCFSCNQGKSNQVETIVDTTVVSVQIVKGKIENKLFENLIRLSQQEIDTELSSELVKIKPISFTSLDWENVKKGYNKWRNEEINKGNYIDKCLGLPENEADSLLMELYSKSLEQDALPRIPKRFVKKYGEAEWQDGRGQIDTLMADINFDGKPDVIFKINPQQCMGSIGGGAPIHEIMYLSFLSIGDEYMMDRHNSFVNNAIQTIKCFNKKLGDNFCCWVYPETDIISGGGIMDFIKSISSKNGIIIFSGISVSAVRLESDAGCCPSFHFVYDFNYYIDRVGKGYAEIEGVYTDEQQKIEKSLKINYSKM